MTIKAILFDHDGTLVDSETTHFKIWKIILQSYGNFLTLDEYKQFYAGIPTTTNAATMINNYPSLTVPSSTLVKEKNSATLAFLSTQFFPLMTGAIQTIKFFSQKGLKLAVVTGAGTEGVNSTIQSHNLRGYFSTVVSGDHVVKSKPAPDCYLLAAKRLNVNCSNCIAIEDTEHGVTAAVAANIHCVAVPSAMSVNHDFSKAVKTCSSLIEAKDWIAENYILENTAGSS